MATTTLSPNKFSGWDPALTVTAEHVERFASTRAYLVRVDGAPVGWVFSREGEWDHSTTNGQWREPGHVYGSASRHDAVVALMQNSR